MGIIDILPMIERDNLVLEQSKDMVIKKALVVEENNSYDMLYIYSMETTGRGWRMWCGSWMDVDWECGVVRGLG